MSDITIRAFDPDDIHDLHRIYSQPEAVLNTMETPFATRDEHARRYTVREGLRILTAEAGGQVAGFGDLRRFAERRAHAGHIGLVVDSALAGQGVGSALLQALIELGEGWYGIKRFELKVFADNARAIDLYQRFGFTIEATHRQFALRNGEYADAYTMARLCD